MRIAVDSGPTKSGHKIRGVGMYTSELIKALGSKVEPVNLETADLSKYDVLHYTSFSPFFRSFRLFPGKKVVVTIHDVIPLLYPNNYPPGIKGRLRFVSQKIFLNGVSAVITDTETSKKDICRFLGVNPRKVFVVYLAPKDIFGKQIDKAILKYVKDKYQLPDKFVLYVGDVNYNKNIVTLINACRMSELPLVICGKQALEIEDLGEDLKNLKGPRDWVRYLFGKPHPETQHYKELLKALEENNNVKRLGFVSDKDLSAIYRLASVYCQPSLYEGFGLPVLEAMSAGTPVVAAQTQALVEISGDAAIFVEPANQKEMADSLKRVSANKTLWEKLSKLGKENARKFSWAKTAEETMAVYEKVI